MLLSGLDTLSIVSPSSRSCCSRCGRHGDAAAWCLPRSRLRRGDGVLTRGVASGEHDGAKAIDPTHAVWLGHHGGSTGSATAGGTHVGSIGSHSGAEWHTPAQHDPGHDELFGCCRPRRTGGRASDIPYRLGRGRSMLLEQAITFALDERSDVRVPSEADVDHQD